MIVLQSISKFISNTSSFQQSSSLVLTSVEKFMNSSLRCCSAVGINSPEHGNIVLEKSRSLSLVQ